MKKLTRCSTACLLVLAGALALTSCARQMKATRFLHPDFDFGFVQRVAVLPIDNLSSDLQAGERTTRILITELLSSGALDVVEPGEVRAAMSALRMTATEPTAEQVTSLGESLGTQAVIVGSVAQSEIVRSGTVAVPTVTLDLRMLETETGAAVWAATHTEQGSGGRAKWLGTGVEPISQTTRRCVRRTVATLIAN